MGEFAPLRTGQLVVRYHTPIKRRALAIALTVVVIALIYGAFELGRYCAGYNVLNAARLRGALQARLSELQAENETLRWEKASAQLQREVTERSYADIEKMMADLQSQLQRQREELALYRGIVSPEDGIGGLRVQRFQIVPTDAERQYKLRLVLVQSMRQNKVASGSVALEVSGVRGSEAVRLPLSAIAASREALPFSFRYFQDLEQVVELPADFEPHSVEIYVRSARQPELRESYPWKIQTEA
jgi:antitoxin component of RelBE/YafQ-DinJ toxin-antitoxin module